MPNPFADLIPEQRDLESAPLSAFTPGQGDPKMEGGWETFSGQPMHTLEAYVRGQAPYVTGATNNPAEIGKKIWRSVGDRRVPVGITDYGPGVKGIDLATEKTSWAKNFPYQGQQDTRHNQFSDLLPSKSGNRFSDLIPQKTQPTPQPTAQPQQPKKQGFREQASQWIPDTMNADDELRAMQSIQGKPIVPSEVIKAGYKASPLYWLGRMMSPDKTEAIATGLSKTAAQFTTPENAALIGATPLLPGGLPGKLLMTATGAYFEAQAIKAFPEQWKEFKETTDPVQKWAIGSQIAVGIGLPLTALIAVGGMTHPDEMTVAQKANLDEALQPIVKGETDASGIRRTEEMGVRGEGGKVGAQTPLRHTGETTQTQEAQGRGIGTPVQETQVPIEAPAAPRLLPGETQGDLISSTQQEPFALARETATDYGERQRQAEAAAEARALSEQQQNILPFEPSKSEQLRMQREYEQELLSNYEEHASRGGDELIDALRQIGGVNPDSPNFKDLIEEFAPKSVHGQQRFTRPFSGEKNLRFDDVFRSTAKGDDQVVLALRGRGFDIENAGELASVLQDRLRSGNKIFGNEATAEAISGLSQQELYPFGNPNTAAYGIGARQGNVDVGLKIIRAIQKGVDIIQGGLGKGTSFEPPKLNIENGGKRPPPPDSIFAADTPPDEVPEWVYAMRVTNSFKRWWEKFWPRDLAVHNLRKGLERVNADASPVITAHQRFIKSPIDFLENFSNQKWWRALRGRSDTELIELEDRAVKQFRVEYQRELSLKGPGADRAAAKERVLQRYPQWFRDALVDDQRIARETADYRELGIEPPVYTGDPYLARLTNEEGKDVVDLNPGISTNVGRALKTSIGSFNNSRVHPTMKDGIKVGTQYEPVARAVLIRELTSARLRATADLVRELKGKVLFDRAEDALAASPNRRISQVRGLGPKTYYARTPEEAVFLEQNVSTIPRNPFGKLTKLTTTYFRDFNLINPLPHITKNMFVKYALARVNAAQFKSDVAEFSRAKPTELKQRFDKVMPFPETSARIHEIVAREVGTWGERAMQNSSKTNTPSRNFIFQKADPAMRFSLWKDYVRKGLSDQDAANHVWIDLIRYDANSGGMNFWKSIPFNFFVPWRTGTYVTLSKAFVSHPIRTLLFLGAIDYLREMRYRATGKWTHLPMDYLDAPVAEGVLNISRIHDLRSARHGTVATMMTAATTLLFGPGGGQAPNTIKDIMAGMSGDPEQKMRLMNMFWGLSQIYNLPSEFQAFKKDGNPQHLIDMLTTISMSEHSALKYEPRRLMKWLPEWMPGLKKSELVNQAEALQELARQKREKAGATYEERHGASRTFQMTSEEQQLQSLERAAGIRRDKRKELPPAEKLKQSLQREKLKSLMRQRDLQNTRLQEMPLSR